MTRAIFRPVVKGRVQVEPLTVDEYHRMIKTGELPEDTSIELIRGFLTHKNRAAFGENPMTIGNRHRVAVLKIIRLAPQVEKCGCYMQTQQPIVIPPDSEPEPDVSIVFGTLEDHTDRKPNASEVPCVIEVADSSLANDREIKLESYAAACIPQYVIVNLIDDVVESNTQPDKKNGRYQKTEILKSGDQLTLRLGKKSIKVAVKSLLP
jgi:Uma2 family endonuclease